MCRTRLPNDIVSVFIYFFKQKTAYEMLISEWSSDVCSSDLCLRPSEVHRPFPGGAAAAGEGGRGAGARRGRDRAEIGRGRGDFRADVQIGRAACREKVCQYV